MKMKNKIFTAAICLAVLVALLCISVGAAAETSLKLDFVSLNEGTAVVAVTLDKVPANVDYAQITLTPKANAKGKEITQINSAVENLNVEAQTDKNGAVTILAAPTAKV